MGIEVIDIRKNKIINIKPNPATTQFNIEYMAEQKNLVSLTLINSLGNITLKKQYSVNPGFNNIAVSIGHLRAGMYFCKSAGRPESIY
ncbi:MAG: T9SS type A sorting domain-containing protein [Chitinophagaceae bacterium]|nr:T9SS type A sorting domain-containing protein [Chitinophagaceae bacterium]